MADTVMGPSGVCVCGHKIQDLFMLYYNNPHQADRMILLRISGCIFLALCVFCGELFGKN